MVLRWIVALMALGALLAGPAAQQARAAGTTAGGLWFEPLPTSVVAGEPIPDFAVSGFPPGTAILEPTTVPVSTPSGGSASTTVVTTPQGEGTVSVIITPGTGTPGATLSGATSAPYADGTATFSGLVITVAGTGYTLTATFGPADGSPAVSGTSTSFDVVAASPSQLSFSTQPVDTPAGEPITPAVAVQVEDEFGNIATDPGLPITLTLRPETRLDGTVTVTTSEGLATFGDLRIDAPGDAYVLLAEAPDVRSAISARFRVEPPTRPALVFEAQPGSTTAGSPFTPHVVVRVADQYGVLLTDRRVAVSLTLQTDSGATLHGTSTAVTVGGFASFEQLTIDRAGTGYRLVAAAAEIAPATSDAFDIRPARATTLIFTRQPGYGTEHGALSPQPEITVQDDYGNPVDDAVLVTLSVAPRPGLPTPGLTCNNGESRPAERGIVSFGGCRLERAGNAYRLVANSPGLDAEYSDPFDIGQPTGGTAWRTWGVVALFAAVLLTAAAVGLRRWRRARPGPPARVRVVGHVAPGVVDLSDGRASPHRIRVEARADAGASEIGEVS